MLLSWMVLLGHILLSDEGMKSWSFFNLVRVMFHFAIPFIVASSNIYPAFLVCQVLIVSVDFIKFDKKDKLKK